ncbi:DUF4132 domain-containing protein [Streptomyces sp. HC44]|uniref:DUF4132 domain-containing protein n=1 Tax=Streptomyces scabichelini TaxID=2711217 RepID=A0A6G4VBA9_9ACTN|nr:DUF4132 domain-containing protein [Streptomyces scabichelini]
MLRVVVERDDLTAACEMVLAHIMFAEQRMPFLRALPDDVRHRLAERCAEVYRTAGTQERRDRVALMHAMLAPGTPDDLMSAERQKFLEGDPRDVFWRSGGVETAWVELASGRDIPVNVGATLRRYFGRFSKKTELREVVRLLADRHPVLNVGDQWSEHALAELAALPTAWTELVAHAVTATAARPSTAWERKGRALLAEVDTREFAERSLSWLALVGAPRTLPLEKDFDHDPYNNNAARGLVWLVSFLPGHPRTASGLGVVLEKSLRKVPGVGPGFPKLANACATALCRMEGEAALAELARLTARVTYKSTLNLLEAGLEERAKALGLGREEIEELAVPTYGLSETGRRVVHFGDVRAELVVDDGRAVLRWRNAAGKAVKSVPAAVRRDHSEELKELKAAAKDINAMLTALTKRLDRQFLAHREWASAIWRERYLDHPLVGTLARRLLWTLDGTACGYSEGALRDLSGEPVTGEGTVRLWHPVGRPVEEVLAWRDRLEKEGVTQPFKQAHREVYLLTDAERRTGSYSNRFAGHVLRQYPFRSLAAERGWRDAELRMCQPDYYYPPTVRELPEWGLRAEYWVRGEGAPDRAEATDSGAYALLAADQVRFYAIDAPGNLIGTSDGHGFSMHGRGPSGQVAPLPLEEIPAQVFSEILRDVDLFVGVASVGNDPTWQDGGPEGRYQEYWSSYSFGELNETARTRHDLLVRLLPRLAVGDRCHVEGRFLHVKGALHTYKIHLRSGNVLMVPGDRYLCIVPDSVPESSPDTGLPFDGDRMLSLILSKALMLADDTKITDRTVLSQL